MRRAFVTKINGLTVAHKLVRRLFALSENLKTNFRQMIFRSDYRAFAFL